MKFIADFHIHSHFSIATSKKLIPEYLDYWARLKGITLIGTGDFTHPGWLKELREKLELAESGLFKLKDKYRINSMEGNGLFTDKKVRFILTSEISTIYKKKGKVRKVHSVLFAPDFRTVEKIQYSLQEIGGNITSDGRPILGLDSKDLLEVALEASDRILFIPAHIWTPWFSVLGHKSGFDSIEECFDDLSDYIYAVETGLSSDPEMNWMCSFLDRYTLISNSDAHSPEKLGREANIFNTTLSYESVTNVLKTSDPRKFLGTIEFFPQEGKYHYDGHRKCNILWNPVETLKHREICPVCNKKVTVGVMNRIFQLSDRKDSVKAQNKKPFYSIIPLKEILSEISGVGPNSKKINGLYFDLVKKIGPEFDILINIPIENIEQTDNELLAEAIRRMRNKEVIINEGYDGEYGKIHVFTKEDLYSFGPQQSLFKKKSINKNNNRREELAEFIEESNILIKNSEKGKVLTALVERTDEKYEELNPLDGLNPQQLSAASHFTGPALILAGPGTGKTRVLTCRIAELILNRHILPAHILAVTFTNKAALEMEERVQKLLNNKKVIEELTISTFHSLGYSILREHYSIFHRNEQFSLIDENSKLEVLSHYCECKKNVLKNIAEQITEVKQNLLRAESISDSSLARVFNGYNEFLQNNNAFDLDDLVYYPALLLSEDPHVKSVYQQKFQWIMIDEYQDINFAQYEMMKNLLPVKNANLYAIGDPNQAIYGFRGADITFINTFLTHFSEAVVYKLTKSYRCSNYILKASTQVINEKHELKDGLSGVDQGVKISVFPQMTHRSEAELIARTIEKMLGGVRFFSMDTDITEGNQENDITGLSDFAILCRVTRQMKVIEKALSEHGIPFQTIGDKPFFKQEPVRSIINILKYVCNAQNIILPYSVSERVREINIQNPEIENSIKSTKNIRDKILGIITAYFPELSEENNYFVKKIAELSSGFNNNFHQFFLHTDLGSGIDTYKRKMEAVTLLTIHAAKGLEFPCVFIAGCEDGLIPYTIIKNRTADFNEEKRLLYVGMTRAKKYLFLTYAKKRFIFGRSMKLPPCPYLDSIEKSLQEVLINVSKRKEWADSEQLSLF